MMIKKVVKWSKGFLPAGFDMQLRRLYIFLSLIAGQPLFSSKNRSLIKFESNLLKKNFPERKNILILLHWTADGGSFQILLNCIRSLQDYFNFSIAYTIEPGVRMNDFAPLVVDIFPLPHTSASKNTETVSRLAREKNIHSVLVIDIIPESFFQLRYFYEASIPVISWLHYDTDVLFAHKKLLSAMERYIAKVIVVNDRVKNYLAHFMQKKKITVLLNGIDTDFFSKKHYTSEGIAELKKVLSVEKDKYVVTYAGRLEKLKNPKLFIEAAREILADRDDVVFVIAGDGTQRATLEYMSRAYIQKSILFLGHVKNIRDVLAVSDIFVQPSLSESFGLSAAEAMSMGIPVIANKIGGLDQLIQDGVDGFTIKKNEAASFSLKISSLLDNSYLRKKVGLTARAKIVSLYDLKRTIEQFKNLLENKTTQS